MRFLTLLFLSLFSISAVNAQDLTGFWKGSITEGFVNTKYNLEIKLLKLKGNVYAGTSRISYKTPNSASRGAFSEHYFSGYSSDGRSLKIRQIKILSQKTVGDMIWCPNNIFEFTPSKDLASMTGDVTQGCYSSAAMRNGDVVLERKSMLTEADQSTILNYYREEFPDVRVVSLVASESPVKDKISYNSNHRLIVGIKHAPGQNVGVVKLKSLSINKYIAPIIIQTKQTATADDKVISEFQFALSTDFRIEPDSARFNVQVYPRENAPEVEVNVEKKMAIATEPFFKAIDIAVDPGTAKRNALLMRMVGPNLDDRNKARTEFESLIAGGDHAAMIWKSLLLYYGDGGYEQQVFQSFDWMSKGYETVRQRARIRDYESMYLLAHCYLHGKGQVGEQNFALTLLDEAANSSIALSLFYRGISLHGRKNYAGAYEAFKNAFANKVPLAGVWVGHYLQHGLATTTPNEIAALQVYSAAAKAGAYEAYVSIGNLLWKKDSKAAIDSVMLGAEKSSKCAYWLGELYLTDSKYQDLDKARHWLEKAEKAGNADAAHLLGATYDINGSVLGWPVDATKSFAYLEKAAHQGQTQSMAILSLIYRNGTDKFGANMVKSIFWSTMAKVVDGTIYSKPEQKKSDTRVEDAVDFFNAVTEPSVITTTYDAYDGSIVDVSDNSFDGLNILGNLIDMYASRVRGGGPAPQEYPSGCELMFSNQNIHTYGGTIAKPFTTSIQVKKGDRFNVKAWGEGQNKNARTCCNKNEEHTVRPYGVTGLPEFVSPQDTGKEKLPFGAFAMKIGTGDWQYAGQDADFVANADGYLSFQLTAIPPHDGFYIFMVQTKE